MTPSRGYRLLLRLAPAPLREVHGREMEELFVERLVECRTPGAAARVWAAATLDLLRARLAGTRPLTLTIPVDERSSLMLASDLRYALRSLRRQAGASGLVVLMLALGIAANVAAFSLLNGLFLRPFPFPHPERLVYLNETAPRWNLDLVGINFPDFDRWRKDQKLFEAMTAFSMSSFNVADAHGAERVPGAQATYDFPRVLGVSPILGRSFTSEEDKPNGPPVVVISAGLWRERFAGDPHVIGRTLRVDGVARTIIGVMPAQASFPDRIRLWVPLAGDPNQPYLAYGGEGFGRLKPGVTAADAERDLMRTQQPIWDARDKEHVVSPIVKPLRDMFVRNYRRAASTVMIAVALLLLIACANVAAVMLARALARRREMGIRLALGSSRLRLIRQLLVENLLLAAAGGVIGLLLGQWALGALIEMMPDQVPPWAAFELDARVVLFAVGLVGVTAIVFGWAPALHASQGELRSAVHDATGGTTGAPRGRRTLAFLVAGEFALAAMLLVCGALLVKAFDRARHIDPGFRADHVLTATVPLSEGTRPKEAQWLAFWKEFEQRAAALPGVDAAGLITCAPLGGCHQGQFFRAEGALPRPDGKNPVVLTRAATPGYFAAMGIRLRAGRFLQPADLEPKAAPVVIVNDTFVRTFWGDGVDAVGRRVNLGGRDSDWITVVGVAEAVKHYGLEVPMRPAVYLPPPAMPQPMMTLALHTSVEPESIAPALHDTLRRMDPELPLVQVRTMDAAIGTSLALREAFSWLLAVFASLALVLAIGGAYGVASYLVTQRRREIGIRVALGARTSDILRTVIVRGLIVAAVGVAAGLAASLALARMLADADALVGVRARDPEILAFVAAVLVGTALLANGLPARRAAHTDPMGALRID